MPRRLIGPNTRQFWRAEGGKFWLVLDNNIKTNLTEYQRYEMSVTLLHPVIACNFIGHLRW